MGLEGVGRKRDSVVLDVPERTVTKLEKERQRMYVDTFKSSVELEPKMHVGEGR